MKNWDEKCLTDICVNLDSKRIPITKNNRESGEVPYYGASGIVDYVKDYIFDGDYLLVSEDGANLLARTYPIAFSVSGKFWVNNHAHILKFENFVTQKYVEYYLNSIKLNDYISGMAQPKLSQAKLNIIKIPVPPLQEQQKIVEKLDKAFELIDQAKANIEQNIINAKELFQSKLDEVFTNNENGWELKKLSELCDAKDDIVGGPFGSNLKVEHYRETGVPILRLQNIGKGYFINKDIKYVDDSKAEELSYHSFRSGDIALAKLGIPIGKTCIIPDEFSFGIVVADVVRIRPSKDIDKNFLVYFLNSNTAVRQLTGNIKGATRPRVNLSDVRNMKISIPNHLEQLKLSNYINNIESSINNLLSSYENKLSNLEELRKSILEKAFKGELTN